MNTDKAQKMRTGATLDDTPTPAPAPLYKRPVIQPAAAAATTGEKTDKVRSGAELAPEDGTYAPSFTGGQQNTGNLLWLWGIGAAIGAYLIFRPKPKPKRRTTRR